jgi:hypothetical protein
MKIKNMKIKNHMALIIPIKDYSCGYKLMPLVAIQVDNGLYSTTDIVDFILFGANTSYFVAS